MNLPPRVELARLPTPIHKLERTSAELGVELWIWRDDLTGFLLSGNKIRKLEFLLAEAQQQGATAVVTAGGVQSNHVRATVFASRQLGLQPCAVLRLPPGEGSPDAWTGNLLLDRIAGTELHAVPFSEYEAAGCSYETFLAAAASDLRTRGETPYVIVEGGSCPLGSMGYLRATGEMLESWSAAGAEGDAPDALFCALGSGGTHAGLVLGYSHHGLDPTTVQAVNVCDDREYFERRVGRLLEGAAARAGMQWDGVPLQIHDGYVGAGYGQASEEDLQFYAEFAAREGILLDPCYTGKAFRGMVAELRKAPGRFGKRILFLHSGGGFGAMAYEAQLRAALER